MGPYPAAAAAAAPALDPPGVHAGFHGLRVVPWRLETAVGPSAHPDRDGGRDRARPAAHARASLLRAGGSGVAGGATATAGRRGARSGRELTTGSGARSR